MSSNTGTGNASSSGGKSTPMTTSDASRIQSSQAKGGGDMSAHGFAARAQSAGARNANAGITGGGKTGGGGGGGGKTGGHRRWAWRWAARSDQCA
ncbi:hypothetical protein HDV00_010097 [Rhizophlyctis rosea]|nr:hypothetical protein HDV00_010097 [Rhizophlyctis rosea]